VAAGPVSGRAIRLSDLARSIARADGDDLRSRARAVGAAMAAENGLAAAVSAIDELMAA
jgi:hypothetical protein